MKTPSFTSLPHYYRATVHRAWRRTQPRLRLRQALVAMLIVALVLTALPLAERFTPPAQAMQGIRPCTNMPYQIIQNCKLGGNNESELENLVINKLLQRYNLPASERARLLAWERDEIRAGIYDEILSYIKKSPYDGEPVDTSERTADEQAIVTALTIRIKERRILAATKAIDEFHRWEVTCPYNPPPPFLPSNETCLAYGGRPAPSFQEFEAYGATLASSQLLNDPDAVRVQRQTTISLAFFLGLAGAGIGGGLGFWAGAAALPGVINFINAFFPKTPGGSILRGWAVGGPTAVLILAIVVGTIRSILLHEELQLPTKLGNAKTEAENKTPDLAQLCATKEGLQEVFAEVLVSTLPDVRTHYVKWRDETS